MKTININKMNLPKQLEEIREEAYLILEAFAINNEINVPLNIVVRRLDGGWNNTRIIDVDELQDLSTDFLVELLTALNK